MLDLHDLPAASANRPSEKLITVHPCLDASGTPRIHVAKYRDNPVPPELGFSMGQGIILAFHPLALLPVRIRVIIMRTVTSRRS